METGDATRSGTARPDWDLAPYLVLLAALYLAAVLLIWVDSAHRAGAEWATDPMWNLDIDANWYEVARAAQMLLAGLVLVAVGVRHRGAPVLTALGCAALALVVDDLAALHERVGALLVVRLGLPDLPGLRPQDLGELSVWAAIGLPMLVLVVVTYRASSRPARRAAHRVAAALAVVAVFAVLLDLGAIAGASVLPARAQVAVRVVEAAGENVGIGILLAVALHTARRGLPGCPCCVRERRLGRGPARLRGGVPASV